MRRVMLKALGAVSTAVSGDYSWVVMWRRLPLLLLWMAYWATSCSSERRGVAVRALQGCYRRLLQLKCGLQLGGYVAAAAAVDGLLGNELQQCVVRGLWHGGECAAGCHMAAA